MAVGTILSWGVGSRRGMTDVVLVCTLMSSGVNIFCFTACYFVAWMLELAGLKARYGWHRLVMLAFAGAGLAAQTWYLIDRVSQAPATPLATTFDWCLLAAWVLAIVYLGLVFYSPGTSIGLFLLPLILLLIGAAQFASQVPLAARQASQFWGVVHGVTLLLGTVTVCLGFLSGLMYLIQSHRLRKALPPVVSFRLPSLEWLHWINSRALRWSALTMAAGLLSGVILTHMKHQTDTSYRLWTDPVVLSLAAMLAWLITAEIFRLVYPAARQGRKVAYLTLAAFVFLVFMLFSITMLDTVHGRKGHANELTACPMEVSA